MNINMQLQGNRQHQNRHQTQTFLPKNVPKVSHTKKIHKSYSWKKHTYPKRACMFALSKIRTTQRRGPHFSHKLPGFVQWSGLDGGGFSTWLARYRLMTVARPCSAVTLRRYVLRLTRCVMDFGIPTLNLWNFIYLINLR